MMKSFPVMYCAITPSENGEDIFVSPSIMRIGINQSIFQKAKIGMTKSWTVSNFLNSRSVIVQKNNAGRKIMIAPKTSPRMICPARNSRFFISYSALGIDVSFFDRYSESNPKIGTDPENQPAKQDEQRLFFSRLPEHAFSISQFICIVVIVKKSAKYFYSVIHLCPPDCCACLSSILYEKFHY